MKIAVHYSDKRGIAQDNYSFKWIEYLKKNEIQVLKLDLLDTNSISLLSDIDGVMCHYYHNPEEKRSISAVLNTIESHLKIPVFPNFNTRWHFDEKISQHYLFDAIKAPKVKSWIFFDQKIAQDFVDNNLIYPLVAKLSVGAGSSNIFKLDNKIDTLKFVKQMFSSGIKPYSSNEFSKKGFIRSWLKRNKVGYSENHINYVYFQEFIKGNDYDIRITVIGKKAFGFIRYNRDNDFRASGSGKIDYDQNKLSKNAIELALDISSKCGFQSMAYDFLKQGSNVVLNEISYAYVNKAVYNCPGFWDENLNFHQGHMWPEEAHVKDFIKYIETKK